MEILTREGRGSWFPSGVYFSRVNRVFVFSFPAFLLRRWALFAPRFNHFLSGTCSGSTITNQPQKVWGGGQNEVRLLRGGSRAHTKGNFPAWWRVTTGRAWKKAGPGCRDEGMMGYSHQGGSSRPGKGEVVCTEEVQPKRNEKLLRWCCV